MTESNGPEATNRHDASPNQPDDARQEQPAGSDVGGPSTAIGSGVEDALTDVDTASQEDTPDSQSRNPE
jgi:hypothetical protein